MAKSIEKIKSGLKLRTQPREGALTLRIGVKKFVLPVEARLIVSDEYVFLHIPPTAELMKISADGLALVSELSGAEHAVSTFKKSRKSSSGRRASRGGMEMPADLSELLNKLPAGYKLGYGTDGSPKLVRTRKRRK